MSLESDLVSVGLTRDRAAFRRIFDHFAPRLKAYLRRLKVSDELCDDLIQEVMISVWRRAPQYDPTRAAASTWIYTIARNRRIDIHRRQKIQEVEFEGKHQTDEAPSAFEFVSAAQSRLAIRAAIELLPAKQAQLLKIFYFDDKSHVEIAEELDIPLGTVKSRLRLAIAKLRGLIEDDTR